MRTVARWAVWVPPLTVVYANGEPARAYVDAGDGGRYAIMEAVIGGGPDVIEWPAANPVIEPGAKP